MFIKNAPVATEYFLRYKDQAGSEIATIKDMFEIDYTLTANRVSKLVITLGDKYKGLIKTDGRFGIYRGVAGQQATLEGQTEWLVRDPERADYRLDAVCHPALVLTEQRIVPYAKGSAQATKTATAAADIMNALMRENFGSLATDVTRDMSAYLSVQADTGAGAITSKECARSYILPLLQELAADSATKGSRLYFDIVALGGTSQTQQFEFRTYPGQRGVDHSITTGNAPVRLSREFRNLKNVQVKEEYSKEINYVYVGGSGAGASRTVAERSDQTRVTRSPWSRQESWVDARDNTTSAQLNAEGDAELRSNRPRKFFQGEVVQTRGCLYGFHYGWGDIVTASYEDREFNVMLDNIRVKVTAGGKETVDIRVQSVD